MKLQLKRVFKGETYTIGKLYVDGVFVCDTLEDKVRDVKIKHETAIPAGTYEVVLSLSARFKRILPRLLNVPGFDGILIHPGNDKDDTSGCILVGENKEKGKVINSKITFDKLFKTLSLSKDMTIEIT